MASEGAGTVAKALGLLTLLGEHPDGATAAQVAESAGYPFSTTYRLLNTLVDTGFAEFEPGAKRYRLGLRLFQLGQKVSHGRGLDGTVRPVLRQLTALTGESSILGMLDGDRALTVHKVDGPQFRTTTDPGDHSPLNTSAMGKVLLAYTEGLVDTVALARRTPHSITDRDELRAEMERVRLRAWATQQEENDAGMVAVAVPVFSASGRLVAALAVSAPMFRKSLAELEELVPQLREAATQLGAQLALV